MTQQKFHISDDGIARKCTATKKPCEFGGDEKHYSTKEEAQAAYEKQATEKFIMKKTLSKSSLPDKASANNSFTYAKYSYLNNHLHNASAVGSEQELFYYSSKAGRLELDRRIAYDRRFENSRYKRIAKVLDSPEFVRKDLEVDENAFVEAVKQGEDIIRSEKIGFEELDDSFEQREISRTAGTFLLQQSHEWMKNLTADEQEAIAFSTSNGYAVIEGSLHDDISRETYSAVEPLVHDEIEKMFDNEPDYDTAERKEKEILKKKADTIAANIKSAVKKAPVLDEPISVYRGTDMTELKKILGVSQDDDNSSIVEKLHNGGFNGSLLSDESHMSKVPKSATVVPWRSLTFADNDFNGQVVLKIKQRTMASPTLNSAWGIVEGEVFTSPYSNYRVVGAERRNDDILVVNFEEEPKNND